MVDFVDFVIECLQAGVYLELRLEAWPVEWYTSTHQLANTYVLTMLREIGAPQSTSGLRACAHASYPLTRQVKPQGTVLSGRSIVACLWPYLQWLKTKNHGWIGGLRGWNSALECGPQVWAPGFSCFLWFPFTFQDVKLATHTYVNSKVISEQWTTFDDIIMQVVFTYVAIVQYDAGPFDPQVFVNCRVQGQA